MKSALVSAASLVAITAIGATMGPVNNPEDQWRSCGGGVKNLPELSSAGINTITGVGLRRRWSMDRGCTEGDFDRLRKTAEETSALALSHGIGLIPYFKYCFNYGERTEFALVRRDGTLNDRRHIDGFNAQYRKELERAIAEEGRVLKGLPGINAILAASEMRDWDGPSYTPALTNAYRAFSGRDIPADAVCQDGHIPWRTRNPVPWWQVKDFPKDRIVPDDWPLLDFYKWVWREGDGWAWTLDMVAKTFMREFGREVPVEFNPVLRIPSIWGTLGPGVTLLESWGYMVPEPFKVHYWISQMQAIQRERPDRTMIFGLQAIMYRSNTAPKNVVPPNPPRWHKEFPDVKYITTAPDVMQEAMWHAFSRRIDGFQMHHESSLIDMRRHGKAPYQCTEPETFRRVGKIYGEVGIPLGPLFRAVPERPPVVAVLESASAQMLGAHIGFAPHDYFSDTMFVADAANLSPYVIYEDEIKERGIPKSVEAIVLPLCDVVTRTTYDALVEFQKRGGRLVGDKMLLPALKPDATVAIFKEEEKNTHGDFDDGKQSRFTGAEKRQRAVFSAAMSLKNAVGVRLYADSDKQDILVHARSYGNADYVFAVNDRRTAGDYIGQWGLVMEKGVPNSGAVTVRRAAGAVYDLVRHCAVPFSVKDGVTSIPVSYETNDGRVFMVVDKPLSGLRLSLEGNRLTVRSPDRDAMIPIRIDGFGDKPWYAVVKDGTWTRDFGAEPTKELVVTSLADGVRAEQSEQR